MAEQTKNKRPRQPTREYGKDKESVMRKNQTITLILTKEQLATLQSFAKDQGYPSISSALRRALDEWLVLKAEKLLAEQRPRQLIDTPAPYSVD